MFTRYIAILEALTMSPAGATIGQVEKLCLQYTRSQIQRTLKELITDKFVCSEKVFYRKNIDKVVYHIEERAVEYCNYIVTKYDTNLHQKKLPLAI